MVISVKDILTRTRIVLQDGASVRWPLPEMTLWVLDGAKEIALFQPSATAVTIKLDMVLGTKQTVPDGYQGIMRAVRNLTEDGTVGGLAIKAVNREVLDQQSENWHDPAVVGFKKTVRHVIMDIQDPMTFYVYPGNDASGMIETTLSAIPVLTGTPADPDALNDYASVTIPLIAVWQSALVDYVLYRSYSKDTQFQGAEQRASAHYNQFRGAIDARAAALGSANVNTTNAQPHS
jgi:hypothetical protein